MGFNNKTIKTQQLPAPDLGYKKKTTKGEELPAPDLGYNKEKTNTQNNCQHQDCDTARNQQRDRTTANFRPWI